MEIQRYEELAERVEDIQIKVVEKIDNTTFLELPDHDMSVQVKVSYDLGGWSFATYQTNPRGYWLHVQPLDDLTEKPNGTLAYNYNPRKGYRHFLEETSRFSKKKFDTLIEKHDEDNVFVRAYLALILDNMLYEGLK